MFDLFIIGAFVILIGFLCWAQYKAGELAAELENQRQQVEAERKRRDAYEKAERERPISVADAVERLRELRDQKPKP